MIKPNWDIFKAKFSDNPQNYFEWFCYQIFCEEFNKPFGIFRYKNQAAIETEPIEVQNIIIGWQAKFYDTALSAHKDEIINTLKKVKDDYPKINKLQFYTNKEWGQAKGKKPKTLKEIEKRAKELKIIIEWRTASFFESTFITTKIEFISKYFFSLEKSIIDLIQTFHDHTKNILLEIQTSISFNDINIEIDRKELFDKIKNESKPVSIISGCGGVGKTVLVKKLYEQSVDKTPFFVFKATEFELRHLSEFFNGSDLKEFIEFHKTYENKIVVLDSAEKLLDLKNTDPFMEFASALINNNWKIIFTARDNYLEDLNYQFFEVHKIIPMNFNISNLKISELTEISEKYSFSLPKDEKLVDLIRNPFYLNEYLKFYSDKEELDYIGFKTKLWNKNIKKSNPQREQSFLQIAFERANKGHFFINTISIDQELVADGILGYEHSGYFITHDIYEEWALEKIIESAYAKKSTNNEFFNSIGDSLPIRRSFRNWVSEKLYLKNDSIKQFIEEIIDDDKLETIWEDEILVSVLLSDYSELFFDSFHKELLADEHSLLKKLTFLLRITCKEVDYDFFKQKGIRDLNFFSIKYVLTKPRGRGWNSLIKFIYNNIEKIGIKQVNFVLPIIHDWNNKFKTGETTRCSSLIALQYYQWIIKEDVYYSNDKTLEKLIQTILYGASEIKDELNEIFEQIYINKWKKHRDPYYELSKVVLKKLEGKNISFILPEQVLRLADLFWTYTPPENDFYSGSRMDINHYFNLEDDHLDYFPASAYQTPIYWLLQSSLKKTIDFIIEFTNKSVLSFANSDFAKNEVEEIEVFISNEDKTKQYICTRLWCTYRGTQVSPHVLESMHMALEKFFLENAKNASAETLSNWLLYLIKNSSSSSITAVVASVVLAYPEKTFEVALVLFQTKKFFYYDTQRFTLDQGHKSQLLMLNNMGPIPENKVYEDERLKACDDPHRKWTLESMFLKYQCFREEGTSEEEAKIRQDKLWEILDQYYDKLPPAAEQTHMEKTWRLYLARMDRRKMDITLEDTADGVAIKFNPDIDTELKKYSDDSLAKSSNSLKYTSLKIWADYKLSNDEKHKQFTKYENDPNVALKEVKEIVKKFANSKVANKYDLVETEEDSFFLFDHSTPAYVCATLIRFYFNELSDIDRNYCKDIILEFSSDTLHPNYYYQVGDGSQQAISVLPLLFDYFPEEISNIKTILLLTLFLDFHAGGLFSIESFNITPIIAIHELRKKYPKDADSLLIGYLHLKPNYEAIREIIRTENYKKGNLGSSNDQLIKRFLEENEKEIDLVISNNLTLKDVIEYERIDLHILGNAFKLIPRKTVYEYHKEIAKNIISSFCHKILFDDRDDKIDYKVKHDFLKTYAYFVLDSAPNDIDV